MREARFTAAVWSHLDDADRAMLARIGLYTVMAVWALFWAGLALGLFVRVILTVGGLR